MIFRTLTLSLLLLASTGLFAEVIYKTSKNNSEVELELSGRIDENMLQYLKSYLKHIKERNLQLKYNLISLNSTGGNPISAMKIGRLIRSENIGTVVRKNNTCDSACVFVLMGGIERMPFGKITVHRPATNDISRIVDKVELEKNLTENAIIIENYTKEMGQSYLLADAVNTTPNWWFRILQPVEMRRWGLEGLTHLTEVQLSYELGVAYKISSDEFGEFMLTNWQICRKSVMSGTASMMNCLRLKAKEKYSK
jgi:ATP-dependent protease ClpP protease subunit